MTFLETVPVSANFNYECRVFLGPRNIIISKIGSLEAGEKGEEIKQGGEKAHGPDNTMVVARGVREAEEVKGG